MTETDPADVLSFGSATTTRDTTNDHIAFNLEDDGPIYHARRPKMAILLRLAEAVDTDNPLQQAKAAVDLIDKVLEPESAQAIRDRWEDPDDDLDVDSGSIEFMFRSLTGMWYGGTPTGGRAGSPGSPARTGKRSTVRSRAKGSTR